MLPSNVCRRRSPQIGILTRIARILLGGWVALVAAPASQVESTAREHEVKAALLFNFCHFVQWPERAFASADAPFVIAILGNDPFGGFLDELLAQEKIRGRTITLIRTGTPEKAATAHLVYVSRSESGRLNAIFNALKGSTCLTIGEAGPADFVARGGMIEFVSARGTITLRLNIDAVRAAGLTVSSRLLQLADIYRREP